MIMDRLMIFIDAEYVINSVKNLRDAPEKISMNKINWQNIINKLAEGRKLVRTYYYTAKLDPNENPETYAKQDEYLRTLKHEIPFFEIKLGRLIRSGNSWIQKGIDVKLSLDMIIKAFRNHYDIAALIAGDSDFIDLIREVKDKYGKQVLLITFDRADAALNEELLLEADWYYYIDYQTGKDYGFW